VAYRDRPLDCPRCKRELGRAAAAERWDCAACGGVLFGVGELARALVEIDPELAPDGHVVDVPTLGRRSNEPLLACSICGDSLEPVFLGGIDVDRCYRDEVVWFDRGELASVFDRALAQHSEQHVSWLRKLLG
jgi:Zn-finger nucleic acid-binding protein